MTHLNSDYLVIGGGIAGLLFALKASETGSVTVLTKAASSEANTAYAQGGIASVWSVDDSFESHIDDTLRAGAGLCDRAAVEAIVRDGPAVVRELIALGTRFTKVEEGGEHEYDLGREGGHSHRRVLHAQDLTGREIMRALGEAAGARRNIQMLENHVAIDLLVEQGADQRSEAPRAGESASCVERNVSATRGRSQTAKGRAGACWGVYALEKTTMAVHKIVARATLLATGGAGKVYLYTTNPDVASGDGVAMAWRAGAPVANLEFYQFHPTCLYHPDAKSFLISEALRGEGAILRLPDGTPFMKRYHPDAELAPRDVVARAIDSEMKRRGLDCVYLDISQRPAAYIRERFPNIYKRCLSYGFDLTARPIPVVPAAHYMCGGVTTDLAARTAIPRLYAAGEVAMTGLHGANRLASNSLLEAAVMGRRAFAAARELLRHDRSAPPEFPEWDPGNAIESEQRVLITQSWEEIRRLMWNYVGIVRSNVRLERALRRIRMLDEEIHGYYWDHRIDSDLIELRNLVAVAELIVRCALTRKESRGLHYTTDYPEHNDAHWLTPTVIRH
ncbi:MAG TPA: L-aspartate oxidase [Candidatus Binataceae bacterium]|nr:L-aspartate oxidase [Candidatus Binataceae bacterium]